MDIANTTDTKKARGRKGPLAQNVYKLNWLSNFHFKSKKKAYNLAENLFCISVVCKGPVLPETKYSGAAKHLGDS